MLAWMQKVWSEFVKDWRRFWILDAPPEPVPVAEEAPQMEPAVHGRWVALRTGGGGRFETPVLFEDAAIEFVTRRGSHSIVHIDRVNRYIFYADKR